MSMQVSTKESVFMCRNVLSAAIKVEEDSNSILNVNKRKFQLPTLEFKKFGGDVKVWLTFWGQFKKILRWKMQTSFNTCCKLPHPKLEHGRRWRVFPLQAAITVRQWNA